MVLDLVVEGIRKEGLGKRQGLTLQLDIKYLIIFLDILSTYPVNLVASLKLLKFKRHKGILI